MRMQLGSGGHPGLEEHRWSELPGREVHKSHSDTLTGSTRLWPSRWNRYTDALVAGEMFSVSWERNNWDN